MDDVYVLLIVSTLAIVCAIFNIMTLAIILVNSHLRKSASSLPTVSFLIASTLQGVVPGPMYVYRKLEHEQHYPDWACDFYRFPYMFCGHVMQISLLLVSFERMVAIKFPFQHEHSSSRKKMAVVLFCFWIITIVVDIIPFADDLGIDEGCHYVPSQFWGFSVIVCYNLLPFLLIVINYSIIWRTAANFAITDRTRTNTVRSSSQTENGVKTPLLKNEKYSLNRTFSNLKFLLEIKATKTSFILVSIYLVCWGPLAVYYTMDNFCKSCLSQNPNNALAGTVVKLLNFSSSILVPLFYCWWNTNYRNTAISTFKRRCPNWCFCCCRNAVKSKNSSKREDDSLMCRQTSNYGSTGTVETIFD